MKNYRRLSSLLLYLELLILMFTITIGQWIVMKSNTISISYIVVSSVLFICLHRFFSWKVVSRHLMIESTDQLKKYSTSTNIHDVSSAELLDRATVQLDDSGISETIQRESILVTGAGGSIGSEICRQISKYDPSRIVLLGHGEYSIYLIEQELRNQYPNIEILTEIADVQDRSKIFKLLDKYKPTIVYHTAAHKHVTLMERNPEEAVKNNIIGTKNVTEASNYVGVKTFVMTSSDKAVLPTSVMGATKRMAEMVIQHMNTVSKTNFVAVRFGNVLGSRGSAISLFKRQIQKGGPVTVTHPEMERYFMTIPEAARLVIQAGILEKEGEIFVLDMGESVKIVDLVHKLIDRSGYTQNEIPIKFTGISPGEKLYEELLSPEEDNHQKVYQSIYVGKSSYIDYNILTEFLNEIDTMKSEQIKSRLFSMVNHKESPKSMTTKV